MLQYLESQREIKKAQDKLEKTIRKLFRKTKVKDIGYPAGRVKNAKVSTNGNYWFYSKDHRVALTPRRLNWFGVLGKENAGVSITVELNVGYTKRNDQVSGYFARNSETGIVYLLHTGRVGGGAKGVGKEAFLTWATSEGLQLSEAVDATGSSRRGLVVMPIDGTAAMQSAIKYIETVKNFKSAARQGILVTKKFRSQIDKFRDYYGESRGRRTGRRTSAIDYISRHGEIVDALYAWRQEKPMTPRSRIVKNTLIDMGLAKGSKLVEVFEVKSDASRQTIYSALGQLMVHGSNAQCCRTIVLPVGPQLDDDLSAALKRLRIEVLRFRLDARGATIL